MRHVGVLFSLALVGLAISASAQSESMVHRMKADETLAEIAEVYMGGREFVPELLAFNNIRNPTAVGEGSLLVIPLDVRQRALGVIQRAELALGAAREAGAEQFATTLYREAMANLDAARQHRLAAEYAKAGAMAERSAVVAAESITEANRNANVPKDGRVVLVHGMAELSEDDGLTWRPARNGDVLPLTALVRTDGQSRVEVSLEDGSELQILENSQVSIAQFLRDERTGKIDAELRVIMGDMLGRIKPKTTEDSRMEIKTGRASIAVRGTVLRVKSDAEGTTRTELLEGSAELVAARGLSGRRVMIPASFGVLAPPNKKPSPPIPLLPPPGLRSPVHEFETAAQQVTLEWAPLRRRTLRNYRVELARDSNFSRIVIHEFTRDTSMDSGVLPDGDYYWRVSSLDGKGLEGDHAEPRLLRVRKNLDVELFYTGPLVQHEGTWVAAPETLFAGRPARDDTSVVRLEYRLGAQEFQDLTRPLQFWQEGDIDLRVRGLGLEGDGGHEQTLRFRLDATPPEVSVEVGRPFRDEHGQPVVQARLNVRDDTGVERVEYSLDGTAFQPYDAPLVLSALQTYRVRVRAADRVGNRAPELTFVISGEWAPRGDMIW